jgi:hypothetical protein
MLYTTYLDNLKNLPVESIKLIVVFPPISFDTKKFPNTYIVDALATSPRTFYTYKKDTQWDKYVEGFEWDLENRMDMYNMLHKLLPYLQAGNDVYFICKEKSNEKCRRKLLAGWFEKEGIKWKEV